MLFKVTYTQTSKNRRGETPQTTKVSSYIVADDLLSLKGWFDKQSRKSLVEVEYKSKDPITVITEDSELEI